MNCQASTCRCSDLPKRTVRPWARTKSWRFLASSALRSITLAGSPVSAVEAAARPAGAISCPLPFTTASSSAVVSGMGPPGSPWRVEPLTDLASGEMEEGDPRRLGLDADRPAGDQRVVERLDAGEEAVAADVRPHQIAGAQARFPHGLRRPRRS